MLCVGNDGLRIFSCCKHGKISPNIVGLHGVFQSGLWIIVGGSQRIGQLPLVYCPSSKKRNRTDGKT